MKIIGSIITAAAIYLVYNTAVPVNYFPYAFDSPFATLKLDQALLEISGLSMSENDRYLVAVQDEEGIVFYLDKSSGEIIKRTEFWKEGDYEGVEAVGKDVYIIKSTGTVYWIRDAEGDAPQTEKFNYDLNKDNDVEGLAYDATADRLLLACKAHPDGRQDARGIYGFSLKDKRLVQEPAFVLTREAVRQYLDTDPDIPRLEKVKEFFDQEELDFSPSALAIHPINGALYLLSSKGKMILAMNRQSEVVSIQKLEKEEHPQPEGLCFDRQGNMYVSNEGGEGQATILVYKYGEQ